MLVCLLLLPGLFGCTSKDNTPLQVGTNLWPGYEPGYLAEQHGYFADAPIRMRQFTSATEVLRAFRNQVVDVAALTLDEALLLAADGTDIVVILVADISDGADVIVARPGVNSVGDLAGQRVAVENTALGAYVLSRALALHGLDPASVDVVAMTVDESVSVYQQKRADAIVTFDPFRSELLKLGAQQIFSSREIPGEIVDVLVTRRSTLQQRPEILKILARGWLQGVDLIVQQPQLAGELIGSRLQLSPDEALATFEGLQLPDAVSNRAMLGGSEPQLLPTVQRLAELLLEKQLLSRSVATQALLDDRLIPGD